MVNEDLELVELARAGDGAAFENLVRKYNRLGGAIAYGVLGDMDLAEDVVQDAFFKVHRSLSTLRSPEHFRLWFAGIVRKRAIDVQRQLRPRRTVGIEEADRRGEVRDARPPEAPVDGFLRDEMRDKVLDAMGRLDENDRIVLVLKHMEGLSYKEISEVTQTTVAAVESRLHRARKTLKRMLSRIGSDR